MGILMPLVMMVVIVGVAIFALNKWNPAAATPVTEAGTVTEEAATTGETETDGTCTEGTACSCSKCCGGKGCKGGKDNAKRTGATDDDGKCICKCEDGCEGASGGSGDGDGNGNGGGGGYKCNASSPLYKICQCGGKSWKMGAGEAVQIANHTALAVTRGLIMQE